MLLAAGINSGIYKFVLLLHITSVVVGIGAVMLNGLYAAEAAKRQGPTGRAVSESNLHVTEIAEYVIYTIPIWGLALVGLSDKAWKFSQTWVWLALVLYVVAIGISHAIMFPGHKRINELMREMETAPPTGGGAPPQVAEIQAIGQRLAGGGAVLDILAVILIALMIWKPGA
jgi:uncharacterized membrane protein